MPPSLLLYKETQEYYKNKFPTLKFHIARNHESVLNYWDRIGTPSDTHRWCCSVMKTAPLYRMLKVEGNKQAKVLTFDGVRAEESIRRENYQRIGKGKHIFVYNAHPILSWNGIEIFLYIFSKKLPINQAYRIGKARVGCLICPFATKWDDMIVNNYYQMELKPFVDKLRIYASQIKINNFDNYLSERKWKIKPIADREIEMPRIIFTLQPNAKFDAKINLPKQSLISWLSALCPYTIKGSEDCFVGELNYKNAVYQFYLKEDEKQCSFQVTGNLPNDFVFLLRRLIYKTAYCINCEIHKLKVSNENKFQ